VSLLVLVPRSAAPWNELLPTLVGLLATAIGVSVAMFGVTKISRIRPQYTHDIGYAYLVVLALLLGLLRHAHPWPATEFVRQVSPVVFPILAFGALVPASPKTSLVVSLTAALMDPFAMYVMRSRTGLPPLREAILLVSSPFFAALVAFHISRVVYRLRQGVVHALEIGSYRLVEPLGTGGMAEVWRADHRMLARPAAVKLIRPKVLVDHGPAGSERLLRLFLREARTTASLSSPHTIHVYDFGITREGAFYYVMELLDGIDLKTLVERFGPQSPERVVHLVRQVCRSLHEAHSRDFIHRDIKPSNVFTCQVGGIYDFAKVLDFGLVIDRHPTSEELEDEKGFVGTPAVMAPEMVRFHAPVDARADIYALGCVAYWLLTGKRVFEAQTRHDMLVMHAHQKPIPPSKRLGHPLHEGLEAVVMQCLQKNPDRRPQTARELDELLAELAIQPTWNDDRAELWWRTYKPKNAPESTPSTDSPSPPAAERDATDSAASASSADSDSDVSAPADPPAA
jgi:serine/threonine-protein kinase